MYYLAYSLVLGYMKYTMTSSGLPEFSSERTDCCLVSAELCMAPPLLALAVDSGAQVHRSVTSVFRALTRQILNLVARDLTLFQLVDGLVKGLGTRLFLLHEPEAAAAFLVV